MRKHTSSHYALAFTIVELLIVVVVIAILSTITIVAYGGITNNAHNSAVKADLAQFAKQLEVFKVDNGRYPISEAELNGMKVRLTKSSYGNHMEAAGHIQNMLYCYRNASSPNQYGIVASSKSGNVWAHVNGTITQYDGAQWYSGSTYACAQIGVSIGSGAGGRVWLYNDGWLSWVGGN